MNNHELGKEGETRAVEFLWKKGYRILERNFRTKRGEIDIIARNRKEIIFVEVKTRKNLDYGFPSESVNDNKQKN